ISRRFTSASVVFARSWYLCTPFIAKTAITPNRITTPRSGSPSASQRLTPFFLTGTGIGDIAYGYGGGDMIGAGDGIVCANAIGGCANMGGVRGAAPSAASSAVTISSALA